MIIIIVDFIFLLLFLSVGVESRHIGLSIVLWIFFATISTISMIQGEQTINSKDGIEKLREEQEKEEKEWNEWRYKQRKK